MKYLIAIIISLFLFSNELSSHKAYHIEYLDTSDNNIVAKDTTTHKNQFVRFPIDFDSKASPFVQELYYLSQKKEDKQKLFIILFHGFQLGKLGKEWNNMAELINKYGKELKELKKLKTKFYKYDYKKNKPMKVNEYTKTLTFEDADLVIILVDWAWKSWQCNNVRENERIAQKTRQEILKLLNIKRACDLNDVALFHIIFHSRGIYPTREFAELLDTDGVEIDLVTGLDPHPSWKEVEEFNDGVRKKDYRETHLERCKCNQINIISIEKFPSNVLKTNVYYRQDKKYQEIDSLRKKDFAFDGLPIENATNFQLKNEALKSYKNKKYNPHVFIKDFYFGIELLSFNKKKSIEELIIVKYPKDSILNCIYFDTPLISEQKPK